MSDTVIKVDSLSKVYKIGLRERQNRTFREAVVDTFATPFRKLKSAGSGGGAETEEEFWALKDVSFEVKRGEVVGIIGRNGAGKSTLLKILSQITQPTSGEVRMRGRVASLLEVGTGFHPELTGRENIYLNGAILGMKRAEISRKFDEIVAFSEVEKFLDTPVKRYSSGMYVRLAFAVAAHLEPEILIVDEVLAVGDMEFQKKCLGKMKDVSGTGGRTVLFVSHSMSAVEALCPRVVVMSQGGIEFDGSSGGGLKRYLMMGRGARSHRYLASLQESESLAVLLSAEVLNTEGECASILRFGEPLRICMKWKHMRIIQCVSYTIKLKNGRGDLILVANTIGDAELSLEEAGVHKIECGFNFGCLPPGTYTIETGAWVRGRGPVNDFGPCLDFAVSDEPFDIARRYKVAASPAVDVPYRWRKLEQGGDHA